MRQARDIQDMERRSVNRLNDLAAHVNRIGQQQAKMMTNENLNAIKEVVSHSYGKANSYSNVIIAAGYVGFFTLLGNVKSYLPLWAVLVSGALILTSVLIFIGFELFKMISISIQIHKITKRIQVPNMQNIEQIQLIEREYALRNAKVWVFTIVPTVVTGFSAGLILLFCFLTEFISKYIQQT